MFEEELIVKMGLDRRPFDKVLAGGKGALATFKGALAAIGTGFSLGAIKGFFGGILEMSDGLERQSEALRVSTDFLQGWQSAASESGSNADDAAKALDKFATKLAESGKTGADVEEEIGKLADRVANAKTPLERVAIASEAFGDKMGAKLVPALQGGSKALGEFIATTKKLSAEDIAALDSVGDALEKMGRDAKVLGGSALVSVGKFGASLVAAIGLKSKLGFSLGNLGKDTAFISNLMTAIESAESSTNKAIDAQAKAAATRNAIQSAYAALGKEIASTEFDSLDTEEQLTKMIEFRKTLLGQIAKNPEKSIETAQKLVAVEKISRDINEKQKKVDEDRLKIAEKQAQATEAQTQAQKRLATAQGGLQTAKTDRSGLSLQELANAAPQTAAGARNVGLARQVVGAEDFAQRARIEGRADLAARATDFALGLRRQIEPLTTSEKNPLANMQQDIAESKESLATLVTKASRDGLVVQPRNGD